MDDNARSLLAIAASGFEPPNSGLHLHVDGGLYRLWGRVKSADTGSALVLYQHLYPFETGFWTRAIDEFEIRFSQIDAQQAEQIRAVPAHELQQIVAERKALRRAREAAAAAPVLGP